MLQFHEWKEEVRKKEAPLVRDRYWYYSAYGNYCNKERQESMDREPMRGRADLEIHAPQQLIIYDQHRKTHRPRNRVTNKN